MVLGGIIGTIAMPRWNGGIWYSGLGTVFVVISLFFVAGLCGTPYYPSLVDTSSSLSIFNSSSSEFTLTVMSWVSVITPFVIAYIVYVWRAMSKH